MTRWLRRGTVSAPIRNRPPGISTISKRPPPGTHHNTEPGPSRVSDEDNHMTVEQDKDDLLDAVYQMYVSTGMPHTFRDETRRLRCCPETQDTSKLVTVT